MPDRRADALGALVYLSKLPDVAEDRIALVGYSQGGIVGLQVASMQPQDIFDMPPSLHFRAAVNFYPLCRLASDPFTVPSLILIGSADDWTPSKDCERLAARQKGAPVKLIVYPGASHGFDNPAHGEGKREYGHLSKYDSDAAAKSEAEVDTFLQIALGKR
jgi:dienelactone hydrolase